MSVKVKKTSPKTVQKSETTTPTEVERQPRSLMALREEVDNVFDNFFSGFSLSPFARRPFDMDPFRRVEDAFSGFGKLTLKADVKETDKAFTVTAELPGVAENDVDVTVTDGVMTISAEKKEETVKDEENVHVSERHYGSVKRSFTLPDAANLDKAKATFKNGVLSVELPKKAIDKAKVKKIPVKEG